MFPEAGMQSPAGVRASDCELLAGLAEMVRDAVLLLDAKGAVRFSAGRLAADLGLEAACQDRRDLAGLFHAEDQALVRTCIDSLAPGGSAALTARMQASGAPWRLIEAEFRRTEGASGGALLATLRDATDRRESEAVVREAEDSLRRSEAYARMLSENSSDGIVVLDRRLKTLYMNASGRGMLGFSLADAGEAPLARRLHPDDQASAAGAVALMRRGEVVTRRLRLVSKDGGWRLLDCRGRSTVDPDGRQVYIVSARDITEQAARDERTLQETKMEAIGRLAGGVAHDFNNLLTIIQGNAELAQTAAPQGSALMRNLTEIQSAADRAAELTGQLLSFGRRKAPRPQVVDLNAAIERDLRMIRRLLGEDIQVRAELQDGLPRVEVDPAQLSQVLVNLCGNARNAMQSGGHLRIATGSVRVEPSDLVHKPGWRTGTFARLEVSDTGPGLAPDALERIFEPYFCARGLGLAAVFGMVQSSGGFLDVSSHPGEGSTFRVYFPLAAQGPKAAGGAAFAATAGAAPASSQPAADRAPGQAWAPGPAPISSTPPVGCVLLVEDSPSVRSVAAIYLRAAGFQILEAGSGEEALGLWHECRFRGPRLDLVVTDVIMPRMSGLQLADQIRLEDPTQRLLLMSGFSEEAFAERGDTSAAQYPLLQKPFKMKSLLETIQTMLV